jgi:hypothetical protein
LSKELSLRGFLLTVHSPSEQHLIVTIDCSNIPWNMYGRLIAELQDTLSMIDEDYALKSIRGRSLGAKHKRVIDLGTVTRRRILKFSPFPTRFSNIISSVRRKLYEKVNENCIVIQKMALGNYRRNLYLLPQDLAEKFLMQVEFLNKEIEELNKQIENYDLTPVQDILGRFNLQLPSMNTTIPGIAVDLTPIELDPMIIEKWAQVSPRVAQLLEEKRKMLVRKAVESIRQQIEPIVKALAGKRQLRKIKIRLEELRVLAESAGLHGLANTVIVPLIENVDNPKKLHANLPEYVDERIKSLLKSIE